MLARCYCQTQKKKQHCCPSTRRTQREWRPHAFCSFCIYCLLGAANDEQAARGRSCGNKGEVESIQKVRAETRAISRSVASSAGHCWNCVPIVAILNFSCWKIWCFILIIIYNIVETKLIISESDRFNWNKQTRFYTYLFFNNK